MKSDLEILNKCLQTESKLIVNKSLNKNYSKVINSKFLVTSDGKYFFKNIVRTGHIFQKKHYETIFFYADKKDLDNFHFFKYKLEKMKNNKSLLMYKVKFVNE